jgi:hypothetical protein
MPLLVNSVPNLAQGVSQQPDNLRFPGQCDEQINAWATVVEGLVKRPPTEYTKKIDSSSTNADKLFTHFVKRSEQNQYCVAVSLGGIGVINTGDGTQVSIAVTSIANSYLSLGGQASLGGVANPLADLRALTVADYTFLVNKNRFIQRSEAAGQKSTPPADEALIVVKLGDYEKAYSIYVDDKLVPIATALQGQHHDYSSSSHGNTSVQPATYISGPADVEPKGNHADTGFIARDLYDCIDESVVNTNSGVSAITINPGPSATGDGWLGGHSTGTYTLETNEPVKRSGASARIGYTSKSRKVKTEYQVKLQVNIIQSGAATASAELIVTKGVITAFRNLKKGSGFDPSNPVSLQYKAYRRAKKKSIFGEGWHGWTEVKTGDRDYYVPPATFNLSTNVSTDPVQVTTVSFVDGGFQVSLGGSVIKLTSTEGPFNIRAEDGLGDQALGIVYREVSNITELPIKCYNGFGPVKVIGDADIDQDDYYVRFSTKDKTDFGDGSWIETVGYFQDESETSALEGIDTLLTTDTMPVTLTPFFNGNTITDFRLSTPNDVLYVKHNSNYYRLDVENRAAADTEPGVGTDWEDVWTEVDETKDTAATVGYLPWKLGTLYYGPTDRNARGGWAPRSAGDDNTNPFPSFVGKRIRDIFFFKNRLGILTDSNIIFSEADEYFNFFRTTTQQLLDSAVIDVGLSHTKVAILEHAVPFQEKLMLFSQGSQFVLRGADVLSPRTVAISPVTEYDLSDGIQPVALGNYIYFPFKRKDFEGVYEYFVDNNTETFNAEEITQQVPKYITSDVNRIVGSQSENTIVIGTSKDPKTLFIYKYFWSNKEKVQSAWMKFTFERDVRGFDFIDSELHLITADTDGLHLEKLTLEDGITDTDLDYTLYLDSKVDGDLFTPTYSAASKTTEITGIPYDSTGVELYTKQGTERAVSISGSNSITVSGYLASYADNGGSYVSYSGKTYYCIETHTSSSVFESQKWRLALNAPADPDVWAASTSYTQGTLYKCLKNHTSPSTFSTTIESDTVWQITTEVNSATEWVPSKFYNNDKYFFIGKPYNMLYRFSNQTLKQPTERGGRSASDYAYQTIRNGSIDYADTGHFTVEVTPKYRDTYSYAFNPDIVGANLTLNQFTPQNGHFRFPVQAQPNEATIEVKSDSALPVKLLGAEFESMFIPRSRRYGA